MQKEDRRLARRHLILLVGIGLLVVLADQLTKLWIRDWANLYPGDTLFKAGFFQIIRVQNTGAAFGIFKEHTQSIIIVAFIGIILILLLVIFMYRRWPFLQNTLIMCGIGLILGGTAGNQIDRIWLGYVTDFIDVNFWPTFNIADSASVIGTIILVYCLIFKSGLFRAEE